MSLKRGLDCAETKSCDVSFDGPQSYFPFFPFHLLLIYLRKVLFVRNFIFNVNGNYYVGLLMNICIHPSFVSIHLNKLTSKGNDSVLK